MNRTRKVTTKLNQENIVSRKATATRLTSRRALAPSNGNGTRNTRRKRKSENGISLKPKRAKAEPMAVEPTIVKRDRSELKSKACEIDAYDVEDPRFVTEYVEDIFELLRERERTFRFSSTYMNQQVDLNPGIRGILVEWMVEGMIKFRLLTETMFLSVALVDRFLSQRKVARNRVQLVGTAAMFVASKFEEMWPPEVKDFVFITSNACSQDQILRMESSMLNALDFNLTCPTPLHFLRRFSKAARSDAKRHTLSKYLIELTMTDYDSLSFLPSEIAAAAVYLGRKISGNAKLWDDTLEYHTHYCEEEILPCARRLNVLFKGARESYAKPIYAKYSSSKFFSVARFTPVDL